MLWGDPFWQDDVLPNGHDPQAVEDNMNLSTDLYLFWMKPSGPLSAVILL